MLRSIIRKVIEFRFLMVIVAVTLIVLGVVQIRAMPVDVLPEFSPAYVEIQTEALGLSAEEVEQLVTVPLEQDLLNGVAWLHTISSKSVNGLSSILLVFDPGTDLNRARQMVSERLIQAAALPHVSKPPTMLQPKSSTSRLLIVGLSSKDVSLIDMSLLARWTIVPRLMGVPGVANVAVWGQRDRQLQVQVDPAILRSQGLSLEQVLETAGNALWVSSLTFLEASTPGTGGFIDSPNQRLGIWHISPISSAKELAQVPVIDAATLRLGDIAKVVEDHQPLIGDAVSNGQSSLLLVIEKLPGANTLDVTRDVEAALGELGPGLKGIQVDTSLFRPASFIESSMSNVARILTIAAVLMLVMLAVLFFDWRAALIGLLVIPGSLAAAVLVLALLGETINAIVVAGLVVGLTVVVDDIVVDVDTVMRHVRQNQDNAAIKSTVAVVLEAVVEMRGPLFFATLVIALAAVPMLFVSGLSDTFSRLLILSYLLAMLASMVIAIVVTPALSVIFFADTPLRSHQSLLMVWLQRAYEQILGRVILIPRLAYLSLAGLILAGIVALPFLKVDPLPSFKETDLLVHFDGLPGTSQPEMDRIVNRVSAELETTPGVRKVGALVGRAVLGDQVVGVNSSELWVSIDPAADYDKTVSVIKEVADGYPGINARVQTYLSEATSGIGVDPTSPLVVRVSGDDLATLGSQAEKVQQAISQIDGVVDAQVNFPVEEPTLQIEVNLTEAQRYGIKPGDVRRAAATMLSGLQVGNLFEQEKVFDVVVVGTPETRRNLTDIQNMLIDTPSGGHVRLQDVADVRITSIPSVIQHVGVKRYLDVIANLRGRDPGAVITNVRQALQGMAFPLEYHAEVLDQVTDQQVVQGRILGAGVIALIGIFFLLQAVTRSWRLAIVALLTLAATLAGGLLVALVVGQGVLSLGALLGLLMVLGLATRSVILMIRHCQQLTEQQGATFEPALILRGAWERLTPIMTTTLIAGSAFALFVIFGNVSGFELLRPLAIVILAGLVTSTLLTLFIIPTLYLRFGANPEPVIQFDDQPGSVSELAMALKSGR